MRISEVRVFIGIVHVLLPGHGRDVWVEIVGYMLVSSDALVALSFFIDFVFDAFDELYLLIPRAMPKDGYKISNSVIAQLRNHVVEHRAKRIDHRSTGGSTGTGKQGIGLRRHVLPSGLKASLTVFQPGIQSRGTLFFVLEATKPGDFCPNRAGCQAN